MRTPSLLPEAAYAQSVVIDGSDRTCDVRSVTAIVRAVPSKRTGSMEVVSVDIVLVAVVIVVLALLAVLLGLVDPHVSGQILVGIVHGLVDDGNDDVAATGFELPCGSDVDIGTGYGTTRNLRIARIDVVPLQRQARIVELILDGTRHIRDIVQIDYARL